MRSDEYGGYPVLTACLLEDVCSHCLGKYLPIYNFCVVDWRRFMTWKNMVGDDATCVDQHKHVHASVWHMYVCMYAYCIHALMHVCIKYAQPRINIQTQATHALTPPAAPYGSLWQRLPLHHVHMKSELKQHWLRYSLSFIENVQKRALPSFIPCVSRWWHAMFLR